MSSQRFLKLVRRLQQSVEESVALQWYKTLVAAYNNPNRHYHTMEHISTMLGLLDENRENVRHANEIEIAIWFHDAVYNPKQNDNETASRVLFLDFCRDVTIEVDAAMCKLVCTLIDATVSHELPNSLHQRQDERKSAAFFLDCDLHILSTDKHVYDKYAKDVRLEYIHYDDETYRKGRIAVLQKLLARENLYLSHGQSKAEAAARENMQREITSLQIQ